MPWVKLAWLIIPSLFIAGCTIPALTPAPQAASSETEVETAATGENVFLSVSDPPFNTTGWQTDFTRRIVPWEEILSGGPPKDGIPAIDAPAFESVAEAGEWLVDRDSVILFQGNGEARAYPLAILIYHEIVNDVVGGQPVSVTFCPLCNASIAFDRNFDDQVFDFGTTGNLRNSDLIMYDRQTETWWQQFTGEGIVGEHAGARLRFLPSQVISFGDFAAEFPDGQVLARPGTTGRGYGSNPYAGYAGRSGQPSRLFIGELDERLPSTDPVVGVAVEGAVKAYPFPATANAGVINDEVGGVPLVIFHKPGRASALDTSNISEGRDIGSIGVFDRRLGDRVLVFTANGDGTFGDEETRTTWNLLGEAIEGPLAGEQLQPLLAFDHFWFAWAAFNPDTELYSLD